MTQHVNSIKVAAMNLFSWLGMVVSLSHVETALRLLSLVGAITVSCFSVWWILRQSRNAEEAKKHPRHED